MQKNFLNKLLPLFLLSGLLLSGLITIFIQADNYGITVDEPVQEQYGHAVLEWYITLGKNQSFLHFLPALYMPEHGGIFDAIVAAVQHEFPPADQWHVRRIVTALVGLLGLVAIALCGYELGGYWLALLAALALWLYPRYYGAIYNNPKDIPAAVATTFVLWAALLFVKQWRQKKHLYRSSLLLGVFLGIAMAIRVTAVIWYLVLALLVVGWWLVQVRRVIQEKLVGKELRRQALAAGTIGAASLLTMIALWPYIFINPIGNFIESIKIMSQYPWNGAVLYDGEEILATHIPRTYALKWLVIGSPPTLLVFALLGAGIAGVWFARKRAFEPEITLVILSLAIPLAVLIGLHAVLYNALRQFLFLVPPIILIAVYGLIQSISYLARRKQQVLRLGVAGVVAIALISYVFVGKEMINLSPFAYTYFSPVVGGLPGAARQFETDYWGACMSEAAEWLAQNYRHYTRSSLPTVEGYPSMDQIGPFLPSVFREAHVAPDFYIAGNTQSFPTYRLIHTVDVEGVTLCVVKVNPTLVS